ncbi:NAD(P)/FAD-dependent oxidoreductase [Cohaesibacter gelatinilyticus]|uniref:NADPH-dependent 2,4-dienoyl-CoA reductase, sulfur reductase n=1 Tax=Cohaesibacter gelatinilyticus TaxID=372072 RepID=A0A285PKK8_9HYPH|nr:FAD/NAD(P)-binding oxidoreductase [Cohaesibacter gelatinilyticus]SNZ20401.1 NADPH-dependent 2,4-dienoyl-CoA reductase, sulfur reductase [Cohaesibacter gelatinilyticus]
MTFDLVIVGSGPAGMQAARQAADFGLKVAIIDEQHQAGGQIYRNISKASARQLDVLGPDYSAGQKLVDDLADELITHITVATVWKVQKTGLVYFTRNGKADHVQGRHLLLATGALERACPLPGWTRPGVMTVGAAQILMKSGGLVPNNAILVGSGPLLYLMAVQMLAAGCKPKAMLETQSLSSLRSALPLLPKGFAGWSMLMKGASYLTKLQWAGVKRYKAVEEISLHGEEQDGANGIAKHVCFTHKGQRKKLKADIFLLHQGVVPNTQISRSLGLTHDWQNDQVCFTPHIDEFGRTSCFNIHNAGDGAGIGGAYVAALEGALAVLDIAHDLGKIDQTERDAKAKSLFRKRRDALAARPFLDRLYAPPLGWRLPQDKTIVCRCEEVTAGDIRSYVALGCTGPNQTKAFGRSGMGPCQGRYCGLVVSDILAHETGQSQQEVGSYRIRAPIKPVTIAELASLDPGE